jgi:hypothetical protein
MTINELTKNLFFDSDVIRKKQLKVQLRKFIQ